MIWLSHENNLRYSASVKIQSNIHAGISAYYANFLHSLSLLWITFHLYICITLSFK